MNKTFDPIDHGFLNFVLRKFVLITWIEISSKVQLLFVIKGGTTTQYFNFDRGALQSKPISMCLFILILKFVFLLLKKHSALKVIEIFEHIFGVFLFMFFSETLAIPCSPSWNIQYFLRLKPNIKNCATAGIGDLKVVQLTVCAMKRIYLRNKAIKIFDTSFSYSNTIKEESNLHKIVSNVQTMLKLWQSRNFTLEGRIVVFKSLASSDSTSSKSHY